MENTTKPLPPWANEIPEGAFISYETTYKVGEYFSLFKKERFGSKNHSMDYYFYDPTEHGFSKDKDYPLFVFLPAGRESPSNNTSPSCFGELILNFSFESS